MTARGVRRRDGVCAALALAALLVGCDTPSSVGPDAPMVISDLETRTVPGSALEIFGLVWPAPDRLLASVSAPGALQSLVNLDLVSIDVSTGKTEPVQVPTEVRCSREGQQPETSGPEMMSDGRVLLVQRCLGQPPRTDAVLAIADMFEGTSRSRPEVLVASAPPVLGATTWDTTRDRGATDNNSDICSSVALLDRRGLDLRDIHIGGGTDGWSLATHFKTNGPCTEQGLAKEPVWAPEGDLLFLASPAAVGIEGFARVEQPWNMYSMGDDLEPTVVVQNLGQPFGMQIAPGGDWMAFATGSSTATAERGTHLLHRHQDQLVRISDDPMACSWAPSGQELACVRELDGTDNAPQSEIVVVDVSGVVAP